MKKTIANIMLVFLFFISSMFGLSACTKTSNMKVEVDKTNITIVLGETENNSEKITATVTDGTLCESVFSVATNSIKIDTVYLGDGVTEATITGLEPCVATDVKVQTIQNNKNAYFTVTVIQPVAEIQLKNSAVTHGLMDDNAPNGETVIDLSSSMFNYLTNSTAFPNTIETEVYFSTLETNPTGYRVENNKLYVKNVSAVVTAKIRAVSTTRASVFTQFDYTIFPTIKTQKLVVDGSSDTTYNFTNNIAPQDLPTKLTFIRNNQTGCSKVLEFTVADFDNANIKMTSQIVGDLVVLTEQTETIVNDNGRFKKFTFYLGAGFSGKAGSISFSTYYENFDNSKKTLCSFGVETYEEVSKIIVYQNDFQTFIGNTLDVYDYYPDSVGQKVLFEVLPLAVENKTVILELGKLKDYFLFFDALGNTIDLSKVNEDYKYPILSGNFVYMKVKNNVDISEMEDKVLTGYAESKQDVKFSINLEAKIGAKTIEFKEKAQDSEELTSIAKDTIYLSTSNVTQKAIYAIFTPEGADLSTMTISKTGTGFNFARDNSYTDGVKLNITSVLGGQDQTGTLTVSFANKLSKSLTINTVKEIEKLKVNTDTNMSSSAVGYHELDGVSLSTTKVAIKNGNTINLNISADGATIQNVSFSYQKRNGNTYVEEKTENTDLLDIKNIEGKYYIITKDTGVVKVNVSVTGYEIDENGEKIDKTLTQEFEVEIYNPITNIELSTYDVTLYAKNTISAYDETSYKTQFTLNVNTNSNFIPSNYSLNSIEMPRLGSTEKEHIDLELLTEDDTAFKDNNYVALYEISAKKFGDNYSGKIQKIFTITERFIITDKVGREFSASLSYSIVNAKAVEEIRLENVGDNGIYVDILNTSTRQFKILTDVKPIDAYNKNISYTFIPDANTPSSILSIDRNGVITLNGQGGTGYIRLLAEDRIRKQNDLYVEENINNQVSKYIRIEIADGSEYAPLQINNIAEITIPTAHYKLISNCGLTATTSYMICEEFSGSLVGALNNETGVKPTITINNGKSLFKVIKQNAKLNNIIINGDVTGKGFVCETNYGNISNVVIDSYIKNNNYVASTLTANGNAGGICYENWGTISGCVFNGTIDGGTTYDVAGIAYNNQVNVEETPVKPGIIEQCQVNFFALSDSSNYLKGKKVGTIVCLNGENVTVNNNTGVLTNNIVTNYYSTNYSFVEDGDYVIYGDKIAVASIKVNGVDAGETNIKEISKSQEPTTFETIKNTKLSLNEYTNVVGEGEGAVTSYHAIMFYYEAQNAILSQAENHAIKNVNTITFAQLFGEDNTNLMVMSSDDSIISVTSNSLTICKTGFVNLTIFEKTNFENKKIINVLVVYPLLSYTLTHNGIQLTSGTKLVVQNNKSFVLTSSFSAEKILVNKNIQLKQNNNSIKLVLDTTSNNYGKYNLGSVNIPVNNDLWGETAVNLSLDTYLELYSNQTEENAKYTIYNKILKRDYLKQLNIERYNGALSLDVNTENISFQPDKNATINIEMLSDKLADNVDIVIYNSNGDKVYGCNSNNIVSYQENNNLPFELSSSCTIDTTKTPYKFSYAMQIFAKTDRDLAGVYTISVICNSVPSIYKNITMTIIPQLVKRIEVSHHTTVVEQTYSTPAIYSDEPRSVLTPGSSGLLKVFVHPKYAKYDYITITSSVVNNKSVYLRLLTKDKNYADINLYSEIENGIRIDRDMLDLYNADNNSACELFVKTILNKDVEIDSVFELTVSAHYDDNQKVTTTFNLFADFLNEPIIFVNDELSGSFVAKNTQSEIKVYVPIDQTFNPVNFTVLPSNAAESTPISWGESYVDNSRGMKVYPATIDIGESSKYIMTATIAYEVNGEIQYKEARYTLYALDFLVNPSGHQLKVSNETKNQLVAYIDVPTELDFVFNTTSGTTENDIDKINLFINQNYYHESVNAEGLLYDYIVNYYAEGNETPENWLKNIYYVNGNEEICAWNSVTNQPTVVTTARFIFTMDGNRILVTGKVSGTQFMRFKMNVMYPDGTIGMIEFDFSVVIQVYTDEDTPEIINTAEAFLNIQNAEEEADYILMEDIVLENYVPFNTTKIKSLDGNNKSIIIKNFNETADATVRYSLFNNVTSNTVLKNISVNYYYLPDVAVNTLVTKNIYIAGFAITNQGIITNCEVVSYKPSNMAETSVSTGIKVNYTTDTLLSTNTSYIAGFVYENTSTGSISNSRVGGTEKIIVNNNLGRSTTTTLNSFGITGQGNISGFAYRNSGIITSSFFNNGYINNNSAASYDNITAGFVALNNSGQVTLSYAKGVYNNSTEIHASKYGISTSGTAAGFVYENSALISDSYSNIKLTNSSAIGRNAAGFVFNNKENGIIYRSYSASKIQGNTTTQMNFCGVDELQNFQNKGIIENVYYYDANIVIANSSIVVNNPVEEYFNTPAVRVVSITDSQLFYGFVFDNSGENNNGVWYKTSRGPELISANNIAISYRYVTHNATTGKNTLPYATGYEYGSERNPILIKDSEEFNQVFGSSKRTPITKYYDLSTKTVWGSYRIIKDLDFSNFDKNEILNSSTMTLSQVKDATGKTTGLAMLDGNMLTIKNISLTADNSISDSFGLFKKLNNGACVKNIYIILGKTDDKGNVYGITAGNVGCVGTLAGIVESSNVINVSVTASVKTGEVKVEGQNIVGAVAGLVIGTENTTKRSNSKFSRLSNISVDSISVKAGSITVNDSYSRRSRVSDNSFAGGLFGVIDRPETSDSGISYKDLLETISPYSNLKNKGISTIEGAVVGGVAGYIGDNVHLQDALYEVSVTDDSQKIIAYTDGIAGGIVGTSGGLINQVRTEHSSELQTEIESNMIDYYKTANTNVERGNLTLFSSDEYSPRYIGGIVGKIKNGMIVRTYSKINVINNKAGAAGGIVGYAGCSFELMEVYSISDVNAKNNVGGIIGKVKDDIASDSTATSGIIFDNVNAVNYWSKDLFSGIDTTTDIVIDVDNDGENEVFGKTENKIIGSVIGQRCEGVSIKSGLYATSVINANINVTNGANSEVTKQFVKNVYLKTNLIIKEDGDLIGKDYICSIEDQEKEKFFTFNYVSTTNTQLKIDDLLRYSTYVFNLSFDEWDIQKWERPETNLFPKMKFIVTSVVFYINVYQDLYLMNEYPNATFIFNDLVDCAALSNFQVYSFNGTLTGGDNPAYGLKNLNLTNPLFKNVNGASFSNFQIVQTANNINSTNALLIDSATGVTMSNIDVSKINLKFTSNSEPISILISKITGTASINTFTDISFQNCSIIESDNNVYYDKNGNLYAGLLFGFSEGNVFVTEVDINNGNKIAIEKIDKIDNVTTGTIENGNIFVGMLGGYNSSKTTINGPKNDDGNNTDIKKLDFNSNITVTTKRDAYVGSVLGVAGIIDIADNYQFGGEITVKTDDSISYQNLGEGTAVGGIVGRAGEVKLTDVDVNTKLNFIQAETSNNTNAIVDNVGGIAGIITSKLQLIQTKVSNNIVVNNDEKQREKVSTNVGGYTGKYTGTVWDVNVLSNNEYQDTNVNNTKISIKTKSNEKLCVGGIVGYTTGTIEHSVWNGEIRFDELSDDKTNAYVGGIVGYSKSDNANINKNYALGDIYIIPKLTNSNWKGIYNTLNVGGIVGRNESNNVLLTNNVSFATVYNQNGLYYYDGKGAFSQYAVNAIIGTSTSEITETENKNYYAHVISLSTDNVKFAENCKYSELLAKINCLNIIAKVGTKTNPIAAVFTSISGNSLVKSEENEIIGNTYYILKAKLDTSDITIMNEIEISSGVNLIGDSVVVYQGAATNFIKEIPIGSVVSGISYEIDSINMATYSNSDNILGVFANKNFGIIYACNTSCAQNEIAINGNNNSTNLSGFVHQNNGYIFDSFSGVNFRGSINTVAGFTKLNNGIIQNCYSMGTAENASGNALSFAGGMLYNCIALSSINYKDGNGKALSIFDENNSASKGKAKKCYYDANATQFDYNLNMFVKIETNGDTDIYKLTDTDIYKLGTNDISLNYNGSNEGNVKGKILNSLNAKYNGIWGVDNEYNFGYPSLIGGAYGKLVGENLVFDYMKKTTKVIEDAIVISNFGKLKQIASELSKNYVLVRDLFGKYYVNQSADDGGVTLEKDESPKYNFGFIDGSFTGSFDGLNRNISNFVVTNGLFHDLGEGALIKQIHFDNVDINGESSNTTAGVIVPTMSKGKIENVYFSEKITILDNVNTFGCIAGELKTGKSDSIINCENKGSEDGGIFIKKLNSNDEDENLNNTLIVGGFVGKLSEKSNITNCFNGININLDQYASESGTTDKTSNINITEFKTIYAGGIVGIVENSDDTYISKITKSTNSGNIVVNNKTTKQDRASYVGGIAGFGGDIQNCINSGSISSDVTNSYVMPSSEITEHTTGAVTVVVLYNSWVYYDAYYAWEIKNSYASGISNEAVVDNCIHSSNGNDVTITGGYKVFKPYKVEMTSVYLSFIPIPFPIVGLLVIPIYKSNLFTLYDLTKSQEINEFNTSFNTGYAGWGSEKDIINSILKPIDENYSAMQEKLGENKGQPYIQSYFDGISYSTLVENVDGNIINNKVTNSFADKSSINEDAKTYFKEIIEAYDGENNIKTISSILEYNKRSDDGSLIFSYVDGVYKLTRDYTLDTDLTVYSTQTGWLYKNTAFIAVAPGSIIASGSDIRYDRGYYAYIDGEHKNLQNDYCRQDNTYHVEDEYINEYVGTDKPIPGTLFLENGALLKAGTVLKAGTRVAESKGNKNYSYGRGDGKICLTEGEQNRNIIEIYYRNNVPGRNKMFDKILERKDGNNEIYHVSYDEILELIDDSNWVELPNSDGGITIPDYADIFYNSTEPTESIEKSGKTFWYINNSSELYWFMEHADEQCDITNGTGKINYILRNDIILTSSSNNWKPIVGFTGIFDGNGKTISGINIINNNDNSIFGTEDFSFVGMFATLDSATIKNLNIKIKITCQSEEKSPYIGGLVGYASNGTEILNCTINSNIQSSDAYATGGIVGRLDNSIIEKCSSNGKLFAYNDADNGLNVIVAGICGFATNYSKIDMCTNIAEVTAQLTSNQASKKSSDDISPYAYGIAYNNILNNSDGAVITNCINKSDVVSGCNKISQITNIGVQENDDVLYSIPPKKAYVYQISNSFDETCKAEGKAFAYSNLEWTKISGEKPQQEIFNDSNMLIAIDTEYQKAPMSVSVDGNSKDITVYRKHTTISIYDCKNIITNKNQKDSEGNIVSGYKVNGSLINDSDTITSFNASAVKYEIIEYYDENYAKLYDFSVNKTMEANYTFAIKNYTNDASVKAVLVDEIFYKDFKEIVEQEKASEIVKDNVAESKQDGSITINSKKYYYSKNVTKDDVYTLLPGDYCFYNSNINYTTENIYSFNMKNSSCLNENIDFMLLKSYKTFTANSKILEQQSNVPTKIQYDNFNIDTNIGISFSYNNLTVKQYTSINYEDTVVINTTVSPDEEGYRETTIKTSFSSDEYKPVSDITQNIVATSPFVVNVGHTNPTVADKTENGIVVVDYLSETELFDLIANLNNDDYRTANNITGAKPTVDSQLFGTIRKYVVNSNGEEIHTYTYGTDNGYTDLIFYINIADNTSKYIGYVNYSYEYLDSENFKIVKSYSLNKALGSYVEGEQTIPYEGIDANVNNFEITNDTINNIATIIGKDPKNTDSLFELPNSNFVRYAKQETAYGLLIFKQEYLASGISTVNDAIDITFGSSKSISYMFIPRVVANYTWSEVPEWTDISGNMFTLSGIFSKNEEEHVIGINYNININDLSISLSGSTYKDKKDYISTTTNDDGSTSEIDFITNIKFTQTTGNNEKFVVNYTTNMVEIENKPIGYLVIDNDTYLIGINETNLELTSLTISTHYYSNAGMITINDEKYKVNINGDEVSLTREFEDTDNDWIVASDGDNNVYTYQKTTGLNETYQYTLTIGFTDASHLIFNSIVSYNVEKVEQVTPQNDSEG